MTRWQFRIFIACCIVWMLTLFWVVFASAEGPSRGPAGAVVWDANPESDLEGYRVYFGTTPDAAVEHLSEVRVPDHELAYGNVGLTPGQWYVSVSAFDLSGNESGRSEHVPFVYDPVAPIIPTGVGITDVKRGMTEICSALGLAPEACHVEIKATVVIP